ncbi:hypothetical protein CGMCC3_g14529 [Colletotrichum fructicola]|nr:uncharacterized protein CGMCC3_g14529 [Colletotrichum fructicola]KAE9569440.1 hypothetical protein CGMCC3_g14529 [Colletotrichum fructicola]
MRLRQCAPGSLCTIALVTCNLQQINDMDSDMFIAANITR